MTLAFSKPAGMRFGGGWFRSAIRLSGALLLAGFLQQACAGLIDYYAFDNFTVTTVGGNSNVTGKQKGYAASPDLNTLVLTGPNDGNGSQLDGWVDLTIIAPAKGWFAFSYFYSSLDDAGADFGGFLVGSDFQWLADTDGESGSVSVPVLSGQLFGFRVVSIDNQGEPGILTVKDFSGPAAAPEPGAGVLALIGLVAACLARKRRGTLFLGTISAVLALVGMSFPAIAQSQVYYTGKNVTGNLEYVGTVNLTQQAKSSTMLFGAKSSAPEKLKAPLPRLRPPFLSSGLQGAVTAPLPAKGLSIVAPTGVSGFNALSHRDQFLAYNGNQWNSEPPSQSVAAGNGYVLEGVNNAVQVFNSAGVPILATTLASNQVFGLAPAINRSTGENGVFMTDMRVFFDQMIDRWFVIQRSQDNDIYGNLLYTSHLYVAVSQTSDPAANYNIYIMDTTNGGHAGCPCIADYPQVGADQYGFHIAWNEFASNTYRFVDAAILSLSKSSLASGAAAPTAFQFLIPYVTGYEFALQPATTPPGASSFLGSGGLEYFASTNFASSYGSQIALWAMTNTSSLTLLNPSPILTRVFVPTLAYAFTSGANQRPGPTPYGTSLGAPLEYLDSGDSRVQSLSYASGRLFLTLSTGVNDEFGRWVAGAAYVVLSPTYRSGVLAGKILNQGYLLVNGNHIIKPALAVNADGGGAIAVTLVGTDWYPTAALVPFATFSTPATLQIAAPGAFPEDGFSGYMFGGGLARWGDYNGAVATSDGAIWMVVQYIGNYLRSDFANWNTYVIRKQP